MFFTFSQNNSGGYFLGPAKFVIIEANSTDEANEIALDNGLYFDGVKQGIDCECCGDRWGRALEYDKYEKPTIYGEEVSESDERDNFVIITKS